MRAPVVVLLLCSACSVGPVFKLKENQLSCSEPLLDRGGDLALKVDEGGGDGLFDYAVANWTLLERTEGSYDLDTGTFYWVNEFAPDAIRRFERAEGSGLIERTGDMDLGYRLTVTFLDERQEQFDVRHLRTGCTEVYRQESLDDPDVILLTDGVWKGGGYEWTRNFVEGPAPVQGIGRMEADRSWTEYVRFADGGIKVNWDTVGDGNGHQTRTFDDDNGFDKTEGSWQRWYDGTVAMNFTRNNATIQKQTWDFSVDASGNGGGTWSDPDDSCDIVFTDGKCRLRQCSDENLQGSCSVPVTWPVF